MKPNFTRIAIILDRSGSMQTVREATIAGVNQFITAQRATEGEASVKLVQFDNIFEEVYDLPLSDVPELTASTFVPRGGTALLDAEGRTINMLGAELAQLPEEERPSNVIVVILTDGEENASQEFNLSQVSDMIKHQRETYNWNFVFLGANQDAVKTAASMGIMAQSAMSYSASPMGMENTMRSVSMYTSTVRTKGVAAFTDDDRVKAMVEDTTGGFADFVKKNAKPMKRVKI